MTDKATLEHELAADAIAAMRQAGLDHSAIAGALAGEAFLLVDREHGHDAALAWLQRMAQAAAELENPEASEQGRAHRVKGTGANMERCGFAAATHHAGL